MGARASAAASAASAAASSAASAASKRLSDGPIPRRLQSLSSRMRAEGWEEPGPDLKKYRSQWRANLRFVLQRVLFKGLVRSLVTQTVHVPRRVKSVRGPYVLVSNHTSHLDAPLLAQSLPWAQARFISTGVARDYFFDVWYRRIFVRALFNAFPIDRDGSRQNAGFSKRLLRSGVPIIVFPEGGRQQSGVTAAFKPGAAALASSIGVPIIPAAIIGAHEAMPKGRNWPVPGKPPVGVVFGDPMMAREGETVTEYMDRVHDAVLALLETHRPQILSASPARRSTP
nr:lysophospholipid acyltransferase family protein [Brachybacterium equifaecis]